MSPSVLALMIPILAVLLIFGGKIVSMMLQHQQTMAELLHSKSQATADPRIDALQQDVADLKDLIYQQTIALDRIAALPPGEIRH